MVKRGCQCSVSLLAVFIACVCIMCLLVPTLVIFQLQWRRVLRVSFHNEFAPRTAYLQSGMTAEIEAASRNLVESISRLDFVASTHKDTVAFYFDATRNHSTNVSHLPYLQSLCAQLVTPVFEKEQLRLHSSAVILDDRSGVAIAFPMKLGDVPGVVSSTVRVYVDTDATTTSPSGATTATPGVNFTLSDNDAHVDVISIATSYRTSTRVIPPVSSTTASPDILVQASIDVTPNRGFLVVDLRKDYPDMLAAMLGIPTTAIGKTLLSDNRTLAVSHKFTREQFDNLLSYLGPPTPNSWVLLEYDGLVLGSFVPSSDLGLLDGIGPMAMQLAVAKPLRTPSGYNCFVDASGARYAACILLISALPIYSLYAKMGLGTTSQPSTFRFNGKPYSAASMDLMSPTGMWSLTNLRLHILTPENDLDDERHQLAEVMFPIAFSVSAFVLIIVFVLARWRIHRTLRRLRNVADHVRHWAKANGIVSSPSDFPLTHGGDETEVAFRPALERVPSVAMSAITELRAAQLDLVNVTRRLFDLTKTTQWLNAIGGLGGGGGGGVGESSAENSGDDNNNDDLEPPGELSPDDRLVAPAEMDLSSEAASFSTSILQASTTATSGVMYHGADGSFASTRAGKTVNSFLLLHIKRRVLDPALRTQSIIFSAAFDILQQHNAVVETVKHDMILASFHSKQNGLRAVECSRSLTAALDALAAADSLADDVKCFIVCHQGTALRWGLSDMVTNNSATPPQSTPGRQPMPLVTQSSLSSSQNQQPSPPVVLRGDAGRKAHLTTMGNAVDCMIRIGELQRTVLRSRLILTDVVVASLPQRIASVLTPVDYVTMEPSRPPTSPTAPISLASPVEGIKLFEDPTVECVLRTHFVIARRCKLAAAFDHLVAGELDDALKQMEDFEGDPNAADVCNWHAYRWRRWVGVVRAQRGHERSGATAGVASSVDMPIQYLRRMEFVQHDAFGA